MRTYFFLFLTLGFALVLPACTTKTERISSATETSYFEQEPPGVTPEVFASGIVSLNGRSEGPVSFSPDFDEIYFAASYEGEETSIYFSKFERNQWTPIKRANFTKGKKNEEMHPLVSSDGKRIYFTAMNSGFVDEKIWYVNRLEDSWSDAIKLDSPINDDLVFSANQAKNGDLFYTNISDMPDIKINYAPNKNGKYPEVKEVEIEFGHHVFISPFQDYLIVNARNKEDDRNDNDLYVSFKELDGTWAKAINLGDAVNTKVNEKSPSITPDGKYLFFGRDDVDGKANVYWVSTEIITQLKAAYFKQ